jgi:hypothetical protein
MDDDRVVPAVSKDTYFKECPADRRANHHGQVVVHLDSADCISDCVLHVGVGDFVDSGGLANPHLDNIYCLGEKYKRTPIPFSRQDALQPASRRVMARDLTVWMTTASRRANLPRGVCPPQFVATVQGQPSSPKDRASGSDRTVGTGNFQRM